MAKKKTTDVIFFECEVCKSRNYSTLKSKDIKDKLHRQKYCDTCQKHTAHKEVKK